MDLAVALAPDLMIRMLPQLGQVRQRVLKSVYDRSRALQDLLCRELYYQTKVQTGIIYL